MYQDKSSSSDAWYIVLLYYDNALWYECTIVTSSARQSRWCCGEVVPRSREISTWILYYVLLMWVGTAAWASLCACIGNYYPEKGQGGPFCAPQAPFFASVFRATGVLFDLFFLLRTNTTTANSHRSHRATRDAHIICIGRGGAPSEKILTSGQDPLKLVVYMYVNIR